MTFTGADTNLAADLARAYSGAALGVDAASVGVAGALALAGFDALDICGRQPTLFSLEIVEESYLLAAAVRLVASEVEGAMECSADPRARQAIDELMASLFDADGLPAHLVDLPDFATEALRRQVALAEAEYLFRHGSMDTDVFTGEGGAGVVEGGGAITIDRVQLSDGSYAYRVTTDATAAASFGASFGGGLTIAGVGVQTGADASISAGLGTGEEFVFNSDEHVTGIEALLSVFRTLGIPVPPWVMNMLSPTNGIPGVSEAQDWLMRQAMERLPGAVDALTPDRLDWLVPNIVNLGPPLSVAVTAVTTAGGSASASVSSGGAGGAGASISADGVRQRAGRCHRCRSPSRRLRVGPGGRCPPRRR
jgi:hypothetical protein